MNSLGSSLSRNINVLRSGTKMQNAFKRNSLRQYFVNTAASDLAKKSHNSVTVIGKVEAKPKLLKKVNNIPVVFGVQTNDEYKHESGKIEQLVTMHKINVFKSDMKDKVLENIREGDLVFVEGICLTSQTRKVNTFTNDYRSRSDIYATKVEKVHGINENENLSNDVDDNDWIYY